MSAEIRHQIQELCEEIGDHQFKYYVLDAPTITDAAFDKLWNQLLELEKKYPQYKLESSPTLQVGGGFSTSFTQHDHIEKMMSLDNVFDSDELNSWFDRVEKESPSPQYLCELKVDGLAINRSKWKIVYADSEEVSVGNYSAEKIFDQQESTFWSTAWTVSKMPHPHQVLVNMEDSVKVKGFRYLPRTDKSTNGNVKSYRFFIKPTLFSIKK